MIISLLFCFAVYVIIQAVMHMNYIEEKLLSFADLKYKDFHSALMPTIEKDTIIGVRVPVLRKFSKEINKSPYKDVFLETLPHKYYEENNLHAFLIEQIKDYHEVIDAINKFLPYVDNWATCDMMSPKILKKHKEELLNEIDKWLKSGETYTIRFAIKCLMQHYLDEEFKEEYFQRVIDVKSDEYYVNMMRAWYFATALSKQYDCAGEVLEEKRLDKWTHNKTIQKATESYCVTSENKGYIKKLKY